MVSIRALRPGDDLSTFSSGNLDIDRFIRSYAARNQFTEYLGTTYLALGEGADGGILGFVTLASGSVMAREVPALGSRRPKLPAHPLPALRLARLGVRQDQQGRGIGRLLVRYAFLRVLDLARLAGCTGVLVDAKPAAVDFHRKLGFEPCPAESGGLLDHPRSVPMFITIGLLQAVTKNL
jgi:GNAT superfamily N-acetyltransferase